MFYTLVSLEKVYTFKSLMYCGIDYRQRSIALIEIICLPVFVLPCGLYNFKVMEARYTKLRSSLLKNIFLSRDFEPF